MMRGLYLHIPFCDQKCHYCNFVITTKQGPDDRHAFIEALTEEMLAAKKKYGRLYFNTLYLGGGTPSVLTPEEISKILSLLRKEFDFDPKAEISIEVNPGDGDYEKFNALHDLGINRVSLGAQTFDDALLKSMNRTHTAEDIVKTTSLLRGIGFENVSMDLIVRLPGQGAADFMDSLERVLALKPAQISLYDLQVHESTVYGLKQKRGELQLPGEDTHVEMMTYAEDRLFQSGYDHYEVLNFAKPGFESRHNLLYWNNREYLGLGPGAFSYLNGCRYQMAESVKRWNEKFSAGDWTPDTADDLTEDKKEMESLITGIRLSKGVDLKDFAMIRNKIQPVMENLLHGGLLEKAGDNFKLTRRGRFLVETVLSELVS